MWLSSAFSRYPIHPNRHGSFLFIIPPFSLWADPTDFSVLYFQLKAGCWILSLVILLAKGHLGCCEGACAWHSGTTGSPQLLSACSTKNVASGGTWLGQCHAAAKGSGASSLLGHLESQAASVSIKHVRSAKSLRQELPLTWGMFLEGHISVMAMPNRCCSTGVGGGSSERLQRRLLMFTVDWAEYILF